MKKRLLIVDDEQGIRDLFSFLFAPPDFEVFTAQDGLEAVEMFKKDSFHIVFMDVHMPRMSGAEAFKIIKQMNPDQKIVIFSSSSDPSFVFETEAQNCGALTCFYKPFNIDELLKFIENIFDGEM